MNTLRIPTLVFAAASTVFAADPPEPKFRPVTIDAQIQIGYGIAVADVDGDKLPDVLLADKKQFVWYRNPGPAKADDPAAWTKFLLAENLTEKDNVCIAAQDIDGDGKCEIAVGAEWNPADTVNSGAVFYLIPPADRTQRWEPVKFPSVEPTTHRMKWIKLDGDKWGLVVVPLHGRGNKNGEGAPVKVLCYVKPADVRSDWKAEVVDESMHMTHNFTLGEPGLPYSSALFIGGREGTLMAMRQEKWTQGYLISGPEQRLPIGSFSPWSDLKSKGVGEVRCGKLPEGANLTATIEPMHGNELVASTFPDEKKARRVVLTDQLVDGHALACGDVLGMRGDQIIVGWRGNPQKPRPVGIKLFTPLDDKGEKWRESLIDDNGMACEDLVLADLNADGKLDIVAAGRATRNVKIYLNERP